MTPWDGPFLYDLHQFLVRRKTFPFNSWNQWTSMDEHGRSISETVCGLVPQLTGLIRWKSTGKDTFQPRKAKCSMVFPCFFPWLSCWLPLKSLDFPARNKQKNTAPPRWRWTPRKLHQRGDPCSLASYAHGRSSKNPRDFSAKSAGDLCWSWGDVWKHRAFGKWKVMAVESPVKSCKYLETPRLCLSWCLNMFLSGMWCAWDPDTP